MASFNIVSLKTLLSVTAAEQMHWQEYGITSVSILRNRY